MPSTKLVRYTAWLDQKTVKALREISTKTPIPASRLLRDSLRSVVGQSCTTTGASLSPEIGAPAPFSRFVIRLANTPTTYLHRYDDAGSWPTIRLDQAKLFTSFDTARSIATLLHGDVRRVVVIGREILLALTDRRCATNGDNKNLASEPKQIASAERVEGEEVPPSLIPRSPIPSDAKQLFLQFVSRYLGVSVFAIQAGYKNTPDTYLFQGPHGTSMNVPTSVMLLDQASALAIIKHKLSEKQKAFGMGAA